MKCLYPCLPQCFLSRREILSSSQTIIRALELKQVELYDLNEALFQQCFTLEGSLPVDLLIRTAGDTRLSNFLHWTTNDNTDRTWPEFRFVINYQKQVLLQSENKF